MTKLDRFDISS